MQTDQWRVETQRYNLPVVVRGSEANGDLEIVAKCYGIEGHSAVEIASLVANAPKLLDTLKMCKNELISVYEQLFPTDESDNDVTTFIDEVVAFIKQVEGSSE